MGRAATEPDPDRYEHQFAHCDVLIVGGGPAGLAAARAAAATGARVMLCDEGPRFGPRTIDLDLLLYGDEVVEEPGLTVPHPHLAERLFALEPLFGLDAGLSVPGQGSVAALIRGLQSKS